MEGLSIISNGFACDEETYAEGMAIASRGWFRDIFDRLFVPITSGVAGGGGGSQFTSAPDYSAHITDRINRFESEVMEIVQAAFMFLTGRK